MSKKLLFFFSDDHCPSSLGAVPTLAALADRVGIDFETYICMTCSTTIPSKLPFTGQLHGEEFSHLANFYDEIFFVSLTNHRTYQFRRQILAWGGKVISSRTEPEILTFYREVFDFFGQALPAVAGVIPDPSPHHEHLMADESFLTPYFYYDLYQEKCLGITRQFASEHLSSLRAFGVVKLRTFACAVEGGEGLEIEPAYEFNPGDSYREVTLRIAARWWRKASGICFAEGNVMYHWQAFFLRENRIPIYDPYDWVGIIPEIADYAKKIGNPRLSGTQRVFPKSFTDDKFRNSPDNVLAEFSSYGLCIDAIGGEARHGFSLQTRHPLPLDWLADAAAPWDDEYSDAFLREKIERRAIPVCFLFYAADLGHLKTLPRFLDLLSVPGYRAGVAFPSSWYDYAPELLEQLYIPLEQGGVFPQLEPLLSSGGDVLLSESRESLPPEMLLEHLEAGKSAIARAVGEHMIPKGYYPWQDSCRMYAPDSSTPQFDVVAKAGFEYYISYLHATKPAEILYDQQGMLAFNQPQVQQWFPGGGNVRERIEEYELEDPQPPYVILPFDAPYYGLAPIYIQGCWTHPHEDKKVSMTAVASTMNYVRNGGRWGQLFMVKPHELARYIRMLQKLGKL